MIVLILILLIIVAAAIGGAVWFALYSRRLAPERAKAGSLPFHWRHIILPSAIFLLSILLAVYFYRQLPTEVAVHFQFDGAPDKWLSREITIVWFLVPQFFLTLLAGATTWGITKLSFLFNQTEGTGVKAERIISFMGNIFALPQLIICFAMLDIFSYNSYQIHIMPMWILLLIILGLATVMLGLFLALVMSTIKR